MFIPLVQALGAAEFRAGPVVKTKDGSIRKAEEIFALHLPISLFEAKSKEGNTFRRISMLTIVNANFQKCIDVKKMMHRCIP